MAENHTRSTLCTIRHIDVHSRNEMLGRMVCHKTNDKEPYKDHDANL